MKEKYTNTAQLKNWLKKVKLQGHLDWDGFFCDASTETNPKMTADHIPFTFGYAFASDEIAGVLRIMEEMRTDLAPEQTKTNRIAALFDSDDQENDSK